MAETPQFVDLIGETDEDFSDLYFNEKEFATRRSLEQEHYWHRYRRRLLLQVLRQACPDRGSRIIELGCGAGNVATYLNEHGYQVDYGDVHSEGLRHAHEYACERLGAVAEERQFVRLDITKHVPPRLYDGVLLLDVLEHLPDDVAVLRNLHRVFDKSRGSGWLVFTVPAFRMLWSPWDDVERHKRRYTVRQATQLAMNCGFEVLRATYFFFPLFFAAFAVKCVRVVRDFALGKPPPADFAELTEAKSSPLINRAVLGVLGPERHWLRRFDLPLGTSVLVVARPA